MQRAAKHSLLPVRILHHITSHLCLTDSLDPATNEVLGNIPEMGVTETTTAIQAAAKAFVGWSKTTAKVLASLLHNIYNFNSTNVLSNAMIFFSSFMLSCSNTMMTLDALSCVCWPFDVVKSD
jgi:hypothetical protein